MVDCQESTAPLDSAVLAAAGRGEANAFRRLVLHCNADLASYVAAHAPSWDACEECVQATWITVHTKLATFERIKPGDSFIALRMRAIHDRVDPQLQVDNITVHEE